MKKLFAVLLFLFLIQVNAMADVRLYLSPQEFVNDPLGGYWHNYLCNLVNPNTNPGDWFDELDNIGRRYSLCIVYASPATHAAIIADGTAVAITPELVLDDSALESQLDLTFDSLPPQFKQDAAAALEDRGISTSWIGATNTIRDVLRYLLRIFRISHRLFDDDQELLLLITEHLNMTVAQIPQTTRQKVRDWMQARGLAIGWIDNQTTVREILHYIVQNLGIGTIKLQGHLF